MLLLQTAVFIIAILGVARSADWLLETVERIGKYYGIPPFILGVVLVGFGTSLPELATSLAATFSGETSVMLANVLGSNIANILLILGLSTLLMGTIRFGKELTDIDFPILGAATILFGILAYDGSLSRTDGLLLLGGVATYLFYTLFHKEAPGYDGNLTQLVRVAWRDLRKKTIRERIDRPTAGTYLLFFTSTALLGGLSTVAINSLVAIVENIGIGVDILSFFALAIGTSLPELVVSVKALRAGNGDLVVGNVIGSSAFNMLLIGGIGATIAPQYVSLPIGHWMLAGLGLSTILLVLSGLTRRIHIWEGVCFLLVYAALSSQILYP